MHVHVYMYWTCITCLVVVRVLLTVVQFVTSIHVHVCSWLCVCVWFVWVAFLSFLLLRKPLCYIHVFPCTCTCHVSSTLLAASRKRENESSQVAECSECAGLPDYQEEGEKTTPHLDCDQGCIWSFSSPSFSNL